MLSTETMEIVKSTAPILAGEGENITGLFYTKLFDAHPELKNIFNMANQAMGAQKKALADSVFAYAANIDKLEALGPLVSRIANKHVSLQVAPEHYPIVGKYLLEAMQEHLRLPDGDPILSAWAEAYEVLASIFIDTEEELYHQSEQKPGGWRGFRSFVIRDIKPEAMDVKSFYLHPEDGEPVAGFEPGQYIGIKIEAGAYEHDELRQYSLSSAPNHEFYRITVKAESHEGGLGLVSNFLHAAKIGDQVLLQPPAGDFVVKRPEKKLVLLAGGVGITPLFSMLLKRIDDGVDVSDLTFIVCARDPSHHIMAVELKRLSEQRGFNYFVSYEQGPGADYQGFLTEDILSKWLPDRTADAYFCGPKPFMVAMNIALQDIGFDVTQLHYETFGPRIRLD